MPDNQTASAFSSNIILSGHLVFLSGFVATDKSGQWITGNIKDHTRQCLENAKNRLAVLGLDLSDGEPGCPRGQSLCQMAADTLRTTVVSMTIYLSHYKQDFAAMNEAYVSAFPEGAGMPVRTCVGVADLPADTDIEMSIVSLLPSHTL